jgi:hypothetical protein
MVCLLAIPDLFALRPADGSTDVRRSCNPADRVATVHDAETTMPQRRERPVASGPDIGESSDEIYDRYAPQVERWARRLVGPQCDAEDLLHDVFLIVMRRLGTGRST